MADRIEYVGGGLKCDNPDCDYVDQSVEIADYKNWVNRPCPKCGCNLLTKADYRNVQLLIGLAKVINAITKRNQSVSYTDESCTMTVHMNGTGKMDFEIEHTSKD